ncbi:MULTISPECIES: hypothetical protein [Pseudomonas]|uniref:Uncharacterized protein n=1 Tax=Pseudomonas luteola TaxID=47886 RepID=A0ABS0MXL1_PSELU|nr:MULTISPECIES: hypothetical protein [Pseudomonas]MBH3441371.1 hypothetical protein [Pseudomonas luteola]RRW39920.1 hypothetical protein EGJ50_25240 [Pseudomonas luteola]
MNQIAETSCVGNEASLVNVDICWWFRHAQAPESFPRMRDVLVDSFQTSHRLLGIAQSDLPYMLYDGEWFEDSILLAPRGYNHNSATGTWTWSNWSSIRIETLAGHGEIGVTVGSYRPLLMLIRAARDLEKAGLEVELLLEADDSEQLETDAGFLGEHFNQRSDRVLHADFVRDAMRLGLTA